MIKLIASDLDGTILLNGAQKVDESLYEVIKLITDKGIIFTPASGRQCESLRRLFEPVADDLMYICENGALVKYKNEVISKTPIEKNLAFDIIEDVMKIDNCELLVAGENTAYMKPKSKEYEYRMTKVVNYHTTMVDDFRDIDEDIIKIAVCDMSGIKNSKEYLMSTWSDKAAAVVSGELYLDFMESSVSKGQALKVIQDKMNIKSEECMAFGDNYNDITLLDNSFYSYAMEKAVEDVKEHAKYECSNVEKVLREIILKQN